MASFKFRLTLSLLYHHLATAKHMFPYFPPDFSLLPVLLFGSLMR